MLMHRVSWNVILVSMASLSLIGVSILWAVQVSAGPMAACCLGETCLFLNELDCAEVEGYWNYGGGDCGNDPTCIDGAESDNPCCTGACCTGPAECMTVGMIPMTKQLCEEYEKGTYVGGATCGYVEFRAAPCPICQFQRAANCQLPNLNASDLATMSDRSGPANGVVVADDFIPSGSLVTTVCAWGVYLDAVECMNGQETELCDCSDRVDDNFRIRIYGDDNGIPATKIPYEEVFINRDCDDVGFIGPCYTKGQQDTPSYGGADGYAFTQGYSYQFMLGGTGLPVADGQIHWLEISNSTPEDSDCTWHWLQTSNESNGYSVIGTNYDPTDQELSKDNPYHTGSGRHGAAGDMAFCVNTPLTPPPAPLGGCTNCTFTYCTTTGDLTACDGTWNLNGGCSIDVPGDKCENALTAGGYGNLVNKDFYMQYDTTCATSDRPCGIICEPGEYIDFGAEFFIHYVAPTNGDVVVSQCGTGNADNAYNSMLRIYRNPYDPTQCVCRGDGNCGPGDMEGVPCHPGNTSACGGDECKDVYVQFGLDGDENCNGILDGGGGVSYLPEMKAGDCITVAVGGFEAEGGRGSIKIYFEEDLCKLRESPVADPQVVENGTKGIQNRYLSFNTAKTGEEDRKAIEAMEVTFASLPPPHDWANGCRRYVGQPFEVTELSGSQGSGPSPTFWAAELLPPGSVPYYTNWSQYTSQGVHVYDAGIIPGGVYEIRATDSWCDPDDRSWYSAPLILRTSIQGDVSGTSALAAPQGVIDFVDISAVLDKFMNAAGSFKRRTDLIHTAGGPPPDRIVDFVDISSAVDCFTGGCPPLPGPAAGCPASAVGLK